MPDDHRIVFDVLGSTVCVRDTTFCPLIHTSNLPTSFASLNRVTIRVHSPRLILPAVPEMPPEPPYRISSFCTNISSHGPSGSSGDHCWNVTFWLWYCQFAGSMTAWP